MSIGDTYRRDLGLPPVDPKIGLVGLGAATFPRYPSLDSKGRINTQIRRASLAIAEIFKSRVVRDQSHCLDLFDSPAHSSEQAEALRRWLQHYAKVLDNLFLVYNGHAEPVRGQHRLALTATDPELLEETTLSPATLSRVLEQHASSIRRIVLVFDCCYAGSLMSNFIAGRLQWFDHELPSAERNVGWVVVVSCGRDETLGYASRYPKGTPLSALLAEGIEYGVPRRGAALSVFDLVDHAREMIGLQNWGDDPASDTDSKRYPLVVNARIFRGDPSREPLFDNVVYDNHLIDRLERLLGRVEAGDGDAAREIGETFEPIIYTGHGGDPDRAMVWYLRGADLGNAFCCYKVGWLYNAAWCPSFPQDVGRSLEYYLKAIKLKSREALIDLYLYFNAEFQKGNYVLPGDKKDLESIHQWRQRLLAMAEEYKTGQRRGVCTVHS